MDQPKTSDSTTHGLRFWLERVLTEAHQAETDLSPDNVKHLRVALRRCLSMSSVLAHIERNSAWRPLQQADRRLFKRLGELRDTQVLIEWLEKLTPADDKAGASLMEALRLEEPGLQARALKAIQRFDRDHWRTWTERLAPLSERLPVDGAAARRLALRRWHTAHDLHQRALHKPSQTRWHDLRVGLKRLRHTVENFLPSRYEAWSSDLKRLQDLLGETHDLDVLWVTLAKRGSLTDANDRARWREIIDREREARLAEYRVRTSGELSLWRLWRGDLAPRQTLVISTPAHEWLGMAQAL